MCKKAAKKAKLTAEQCSTDLSIVSYVVKRHALDGDEGIMMASASRRCPHQIHYERSQCRIVNHPVQGKAQQEQTRLKMFGEGYKEPSGQVLKVVNHVFSNKEYLRYDGVDQLNEGACSLVGFLNLVQVYNLKHPDTRVDMSFNANGTEFDYNDVMMYWGDLWYAMQPYAEKEGMVDIASMLDAADALNILKGNLREKIEYIPIRSYGSRENRFNRRIVPNTRFDLEEAQVAVSNFFMGLIDGGIPFAVNCDEHTRVCIGYTDSSFVFADSWGSSAVQSEFDPVDQRINLIVAGYSFSPKEHISRWAKDAVFLKDDAVAMVRTSVAGARSECKLLIKQLLSFDDSPLRGGHRNESAAATNF